MMTIHRIDLNVKKSQQLAGHQYTVRRSGPIIWVKPFCQMLADNIRARHVRVCQPDSGGVRFQACRHFLGSLPYDNDRDKPTALGFRAGLESIVITFIESHGGIVRRCGDKVDPLPIPFQFEWPFRDDALINQMRSHDRFLIRFDPPDDDRIRFLELIAKAFPKLRIVVVTTSIPLAKAIGHDLESCGLETVRVVHNCHSDQSCRLAVAPFGQLHFDQVALHHRQLVIIYDALTALYKKSWEILSHIESARLIGFLPMSTTVSPAEADSLIEIFGPAQVVIPQHGQVVRPIELSVMTNHIAAPNRECRNPVMIYNEQIVCNRGRTRLICKLAGSLARGERDACETRLKDVPNWFTWNQGHVVMIVVRDREHAMRIERQMRDDDIRAVKTHQKSQDNSRSPLGKTEHWIVNCKQQSTSKSSGTEALRYDESAVAHWVKPNRSGSIRIVTLDDFRSTTWTADVIIRADGSPGELALPPWARSTYFPNPPIWLIDIADRTGAMLRRAARMRHQYYSEVEWPRVGETVGQLTIQRFLRKSAGCM